MVDQFDNGWRCARLGVARTLDYKAWTAGRARTALKAVLASERLAERARDVAGIIATETGADTAAELILHLQPKI
jgi:UDP:flavonoid glycosyltransferase YjiC (YdhE family)